MEIDLDMEQPLSIWLCPDTTANQHFQRTIDDIAEQERALPFAPHVTLLGDILAAPRDIETLCRLTFVEQGAVEARVAGLATTNQFFMSLFVDLDVPPDVHDVRHNLADRLGIDAVQDFRPHLSLAYGLAADAQARQNGRTKAAIKGWDKLFLDTVVIASSSSRLPINLWKTLIKIKLTKS